MYMIINLTSGSNEGMTAEAVKYGDYSVAETLDGLKFSTNFLSDYVTGVDETVGSLVDELTANGNRIYLDYKDGKYGYNTSASRGADTFSPFRSGSGIDSDYPLLTTVSGVSSIPEITGTGYILVKVTSSQNNVTLSVYIDGNTQSFPVVQNVESGLIRGSFYKFYFQESIRVVINDQSAKCFYQVRLADKPTDKKYNITQGITNSNQSLTLSGKGKVVISPSNRSIDVEFIVDGGSTNAISLYGNQYLEIEFNNSFNIKNVSAQAAMYYIAYVEI